MPVAHLEKVLKHAERRLINNAQKSPTDMLDLYREFLRVEEHRLFLAHRAGDDSKEIAYGRGDMYRVAIRHMFEESLANAERAHKMKREVMPICLMAVGGFGRGEMCPKSDIDVLFLYRKTRKKSPEARFMNDVIEQVLYVLWDVGLKVGHASRTLDEVIQEGNSELQTKTALLETDWLAGDKTLYNDFELRFHRSCIKGYEKAYLDWRINDQDERHEKHGSTVFLQEPNVKNGCGGLRDYQNLLWVARVRHGICSMKELEKKKWLTAPEYKKIEQAYEFLLKMRMELHYQEKRAYEVMTIKLQGQIANALKYPQKNVILRTEHMMREYYAHTRNMCLITNLLARRFCGEELKGAPNPPWWLPVTLRKREEIEGFVLENGMLELENDKLFDNDPFKIARVFRLLQKYEANLSPRLQALIRDRHFIANRKKLWSPQVRDLLTTIFSQKGKVGRITRVMHETEVLGKLIPEFGPMFCLVQHEFYHRYTADEHTLVCVEQLDKVLDAPNDPFKKYRQLLVDCSYPDILYFAMLLHDVGKAAGTDDHTAAGTELAIKFAKRMGIKGHRRSILLFLVDHHQTLSEISQKRDIDSVETIREFARIVQDQERLEMLMLITFADGQGTAGEENWSDWKETLVWHLFRSTSRMIKGEDEFLRNTAEVKENLLKEVRQMTSKEVDDQQFALHFQGLPTRYLRGGNASLIAAQLECVNEFYKAQVSLDADPLAPQVRWMNKENIGHSQLIVVTWDRGYLMSKIAGALEMAEINILSADILTREDCIVIDSFRVCTPRLEAVTDKRDHKAFYKYLYKSLNDPEFDLEKELPEAQKKRKRKFARGQEVETAVGIDNETSETHTLIHIRAADYEGLLHDILVAMEPFGLIFVSARIMTEKGMAMDTFYVTDSLGQKLFDREFIGNLLRSLENAIVPPSVE